MNRRTALTAMVVTASGLAVASPLRRADAATPVNPGGTAMDVNQAVVNYISIWNERDATRRRALIAQTLSEDCSYVGPQREGAGQDAIDAMIATAQIRTDAPPGAAPGVADEPGERHRHAPQLRALQLDRRRHGRSAALYQANRLCHPRRRRKIQIGDRLQRHRPGSAAEVVAALGPSPARSGDPNKKGRLRP